MDRASNSNMNKAFFNIYSTTRDINSKQRILRSVAKNFTISETAYSEQGSRIFNLITKL